MTPPLERRSAVVSEAERRAELLNKLSRDIWPIFEWELSIDVFMRHSLGEIKKSDLRQIFAVVGTPWSGKSDFIVKAVKLLLYEGVPVDEIGYVNWEKAEAQVRSTMTAEENQSPFLSRLKLMETNRQVEENFRRQFKNKRVILSELPAAIAAQVTKYEIPFWLGRPLGEPALASLVQDANLWLVGLCPGPSMLDAMYRQDRPEPNAPRQVIRNHQGYVAGLAYELYKDGAIAPPAYIVDALCEPTPQLERSPRETIPDQIRQHDAEFFNSRYAPLIEETVSHKIEKQRHTILNETFEAVYRETYRDRLLYQLCKNSLPGAYLMNHARLAYGIPEDQMFIGLNNPPPDELENMHQP